MRVRVRVRGGRGGRGEDGGEGLYRKRGYKKQRSNIHFFYSASKRKRKRKKKRTRIQKDTVLLVGGTALVATPAEE